MKTGLAPMLLAGTLSLGPAVVPDGPGPIFRAIEILERRPPGAPPRVRFEWSSRAGATEYLLIGSWTGPESWTVQARQFRVTRQNATSWTDREITFEVSLMRGSHSWKLVPVRHPNGTGDLSDTAHLAFDLQ